GMDDAVLALTVFDDGNGPALYAGGWFTDGSDWAIMRWRGSGWSPIGPGPSFALTVFDDGNGPALIAGGDLFVGRIAEGNGMTWSTLGTGITGGPQGVLALVVHDDGGGPDLYAGGDFDGAGGVVSKGIAKWNGTSWSALGTGVGGAFPSTVRAL